MSNDISDRTLPAGWAQKQLGEVCKVISGSTPKTSVSDYWGGEIPWLTPNDLSKNRNKVVEGGERYITQLGFDSCSTQMVPKGSVLFTSRAPIGYVAIAGVPMCTNQGFKSAVPNEDIGTAFLYWQLQNLTDDVRSRASGTTFLEISGRGFAATTLVVPPLREQEKIVEVLEEQLSRLDAALASVRAVREKSTRFRRSLLHAAFTGALTGADSENSNTDVRVSVFEDLFDLISNDRRQVKQKDYKKSGKFPVVDQGEETVGGFIDDGDLLFDGALPVIVFGDHTRRLKFIDFPFVVGADGTKLIQCKEVVLPRYGFYHLEAAEFRNRGYARHFGELKKVMFWLPSIQLQEKIVEILEEQFLRLEASLAVVDGIEKKALALRRSLLHAAFTGNLTKEWRGGAYV